MDFSYGILLSLNKKEIKYPIRAYNGMLGFVVGDFRALCSFSILN